MRSTSAEKLIKVRPKIFMCVFIGEEGFTEDMDVQLSKSRFLRTQTAKVLGTHREISLY